MILATNPYVNGKYSTAEYRVSPHLTHTPYHEYFHRQFQPIIRFTYSLPGDRYPVFPAKQSAWNISYYDTETYYYTKWIFANLRSDPIDIEDVRKSIPAQRGPQSATQPHIGWWNPERDSYDIEQVQINVNEGVALNFEHRLYMVTDSLDDICTVFKSATATEFNLDMSKSNYYKFTNHVIESISKFDQYIKSTIVRASMIERLPI